MPASLFVFLWPIKDIICETRVVQVVSELMSEVERLKVQIDKVQRGAEDAGRAAAAKDDRLR